MFEFNPERLSRARKYLYAQKKKKNRNSYQPEDVRFARMVREESQFAPIEIPKTVASRPVKIVKWYDRVK